MPAYALTTVDNPYHPIDEIGKWKAFEIAHGYDTCGVLANVLKAMCPCYGNGRDSLLFYSEDQCNINAAIDEIMRLDDIGMYKRIRIE